MPIHPVIIAHLPSHIPPSHILDQKVRSNDELSRPCGLVVARTPPPPFWLSTGAVQKLRCRNYFVQVAVGGVEGRLPLIFIKSMWRRSRLEEHSIHR